MSSISKFDVKQLIRAITASRTYQLSATPNATNEKDATNYSRALFRRVDAEVLLDMVSQTTGVAEKFSGAPSQQPGDPALGQQGASLFPEGLWPAAADHRL